MKYLKNALVAWFAILCVVNIAGCNRHEPGSYKNDEIDATIRKEFQEKNELLFEGLEANKPRRIESILSKEMLNDPGTNRTVELSSIHMRNGKTVMLDEYYMVHEFQREYVINNSGHGINNYKLTYQPATREQYMAFYIIQNGVDRWLLSAIYNKLDYGWKLCELDLSPYTISGKTSPELYRLARQQYAKKYLIDAVNTMILSRSCSLPNVMWSYADAEEMNKFYAMITEEAQNAYSFPVVVTQMKAKPKIFRVFNQAAAEGNFPMIYYLSKIKLKDTAALKKENEELRKVIGQVMPGIDREKKYVFYTVFNEMPYTKKKSPEFFEIRCKLQ
jgi:hypothetical protein